MSETRYDELTGTETTGHEWDGIRELNTPLPAWWVYTLWATVVWAIGYCIVYPAWPTGGTNAGVLEYSSRQTLNRQMAAVAESRSAWLDRFRDAEVADIARDPELLAYAIAGGRSLFADNCAPCHGAGGAGARGYPSLADDAWIWGGTLEAIQQTIRYGVRSEHDETRLSDMPRFLADGILERDEVAAVAGYVLSLGGRGAAGEEGKALFEENCATCHGEEGEGDPELGAPDLTDAIWIQGGARADIEGQIADPSHGVMPPWEGRLDGVAIKQLAIYVHSLGGGQ